MFFRSRRFGVLMAVLLMLGFYLIYAYVRRENEYLEDFGAFYVKFNEDSVFQKSRVRCNTHGLVFDIPGLNQSPIIVTRSVLENEVKEVLTLEGDSIPHIDFTFRRDSGKWFLVGYVDRWID